MGRFTTIRVLAFGALLFLLAPPTEAQRELEPTWRWNDALGRPRTRDELEKILAEHREWVHSGGEQGRRANLSYAQLPGVDLPSVDWGTPVLKGADLSHADLNEAHLGSADLRGANLFGANLTGTDLGGADLSGADLREADLAKTNLYAADLAAAIFEPKSLPEIRVVAAASNLEFLTYESSPDALVQLRKGFEDSGFRAHEREITYAVKRREAGLSWEGCKSWLPLKYWTIRKILWSSDSNLANCGSFVLNRVFFDWTCQYGMSPGRPLSIGILLWLVCSMLYFAFIHTSGEAGLYRIYVQGIPEDPSVARCVERIVPAGKPQKRGLKRVLQFLREEWLALRASMFFSLMSAFNIGFRDINFGRWLRLLTRHEFDMKAIGWVRVVAGWQSLLSVYLVALWLLTLWFAKTLCDTFRAHVALLHPDQTQPGPVSHLWMLLIWKGSQPR